MQPSSHTGSSRGPAPDLGFEAHRQALTGHCYRMLGSAADADDAVQETLVRAWRHHDRFEGRGSLKSWLYRIATRVCLDHLADRGRRARPMDLGPAGTIEGPLGDPIADEGWVLPIPDVAALPSDADPAERTILRESIRLAFVASLQLLPPRQRAVLLLKEVLGWSAAEIASTLDTSVASVNSALQRARATLSRRAPTAAPGELSEADAGLLGRYVEAFERYDVDALVGLLHEDATFSMPPFPLWLCGPESVRGWLLGPGAECRGSRLVPTSANGSPAFGQYRPSGPGGRHEPWCLIVVEASAGRIVGLNHFLDTASLFPRFGLPPHLDQVGAG